MSKLESLSRQIYAINYLINRPASLKEIMNHLQQKEVQDDRSYVVSQRTFERDVREIKQLFGYEIKFNRKLKKYKIENQLENRAGQKVMEAFDMLNATNQSSKVKEYLMFEQRKPQGTEHFQVILKCITEKKMLSFEYQKFWDDTSSHRVVEPYALREFKSRWYLVAKEFNDEKDTIKTFGLDRLSNPELKSKSFIYPDKAILKKKFDYCFGVITPDKGEPENIELSFTPFQGKYIKTMPLHPTQKVLKDNDKECIISLKLFNTIDFRMEILSYGKEMKVLKPKSLAKQIDEMHRSAIR